MINFMSVYVCVHVWECVCFVYLYFLKKHVFKELRFFHGCIMYIRGYYDRWNIIGQLLVSSFIQEKGREWGKGINPLIYLIIFSLYFMNGTALSKNFYEGPLKNLCWDFFINCTYLLLQYERPNWIFNS